MGCMLRSHRGFTVLEILIVLAITVLIGVVGFSTTGSIRTLATVDVVRNELLTNLRLAQLHALSGTRGTGAGIIIDATGFTLFHGDAYATRDMNTDRRALFPAGAGVTSTGFPNLGSGAEVQFRSGSGLPVVTGTITVTRGVSTRTIAVNGEGLITDVLAVPP